MRKLVASGLALAASVWLISACGTGGGSSGANAGAGTPVTVTVGSLPIVTEAPLYIGIEKGFFKQQGLTVRPQLAEGGAAIVPAVMSGSEQMGTSNPVSLMIAADKGLPLQLIAQGARGGTIPSNDISAVLVAKGSSIKTPKDLEGKTIAVNTLENIGDVTIKASLQKAGVNISTLKFIEIPFPDMNAALNSGRVDAVWAVDPFLTQGLEQGERPVIYNYSGTASHLTVGMYFASKPYIEQHCDVVRRFVKAINQAVDYAGSHPAEVRKIVLTYTKIPPTLAKRMRLPYWRSSIDTGTLSLLGTLVHRYGLIKQAPNLGTLIWSGGS